MPGRAFQLRVRAGKEAVYDETHQHVWPELLDELRRLSFRDDSTFHRQQELSPVLRVPNWDVLVAQLASSEIKLRWQRRMASSFRCVRSPRRGESFATMEEVFPKTGGPA